jgi:hypothetical protein
LELFSLEEEATLLPGGLFVFIFIFLIAGECQRSSAGAGSRAHGTLLESFRIIC